MPRARRIVGDEASRFWPKVTKRRGGCWLWTAATRADGYGIFRRSNGTNIRAHVWAWEQEHGPVPDGLELDHVRERGCTNRNCVRPSHLDAVTHAENVRRGIPGGRQWRRLRTHCKNGHLFDERTTRIYRGQRQCRACRNEQDRARYARRKA